MENTPTDYRALCAELLRCWDDEVEDLNNLGDIFDRARAALAQPEPEGPSDRIISIAMATQKCAFAWEPTARLIGNVCAEDIADLCGAVLARSGRPAIKPVPVSERLPGEGDCDSEGRCWWEYPESKRIVYDMNPIDKEEITTPPAYYLQKKHPLCSPNQRWLPHWALPVPATRREEN